jgi:hypothetical protein
MCRLHPSAPHLIDLIALNLTFKLKFNQIITDREDFEGLVRRSADQSVVQKVEDRCF